MAKWWLSQTSSSNPNCREHRLSLCRIENDLPPRTDASTAFATLSIDWRIEIHQWILVKRHLMRGFVYVSTSTTVNSPTESTRISQHRKRCQIIWHQLLTYIPMNNKCLAKNRTVNWIWKLVDSKWSTWRGLTQKRRLACVCAWECFHFVPEQMRAEIENGVVRWFRIVSFPQQRLLWKRSFLWCLGERWRVMRRTTRPHIIWQVIRMPKNLFIISFASQDCRAQIKNNNTLPFGCILFSIFCCGKGWGWVRVCANVIDTKYVFSGVRSGWIEYFRKKLRMMCAVLEGWRQSWSDIHLHIKCIWCGALENEKLCCTSRKTTWKNSP